MDGRLHQYKGDRVSRNERGYLWRRWKDQWHHVRIADPEQKIAMEDAGYTRHLRRHIRNGKKNSVTEEMNICCTGIRDERHRGERR